MRIVMKVSVLVIAMVSLLACFAVAQDAPKPKVSATGMGPLPAPPAAPVQPQVAPTPTRAPVATPQVPPVLSSFALTPPQTWLDVYASHPYQKIQEGWRDYVIREQSRAIVALQKRVEALEKAGQAYGGEPVEQNEAKK